MEHSRLLRFLLPKTYILKMADENKIKFDYQNPDNVEAEVPGAQNLREVSSEEENTQNSPNNYDVSKNDSSTSKEEPGDDETQVMVRHHRVITSKRNGIHGEPVPLEDKLEDKRSKTKIPISKFRQTVDRVKAARRESREKKELESHIPVRRSSIPKPVKDSKATTSVKKETTVTKTEVNESPKGITDKTAITQAITTPEDEFDKLYAEIVTTPTNDDNLLNSNIEDPDKIESTFEQIIHDYDENKIEPIDVELRRSKIPSLNRRSLQGIELSVQAERTSKIIAARDKLRMKRNSLTKSGDFENELDRELKKSESDFTSLSKTTIKKEESVSKSENKVTDKKLLSSSQQSKSSTEKDWEVSNETTIAKEENTYNINSKKENIKTTLTEENIIKDSIKIGVPVFESQSQEIFETNSTTKSVELNTVHIFTTETNASIVPTEKIILTNEFNDAKSESAEINRQISRENNSNIKISDNSVTEIDIKTYNSLDGDESQISNSNKINTDFKEEFGNKIENITIKTEIKDINNQYMNTPKEKDIYESKNIKNDMITNEGNQKAIDINVDKTKTIDVNDPEDFIIIEQQNSKVNVTEIELQHSQSIEHTSVDANKLKTDAEKHNDLATANNTDLKSNEKNNDKEAQSKQNESKDLVVTEEENSQINIADVNVQHSQSIEHTSVDTNKLKTDTESYINITTANSTNLKSSITNNDKKAQSKTLEYQENEIKSNKRIEIEHRNTNNNESKFNINYYERNNMNKDAKVDNIYDSKTKKYIASKSYIKSEIQLRHKDEKSTNKNESKESIETGINKRESINELMKKKSVLSKIAMFEKKETEPVQVRGLKKDIKPPNLMIKDFKRTEHIHIHTPLIVDEVMKQFQSELKLINNVDNATELNTSTSITTTKVESNQTVLDLTIVKNKEANAMKMELQTNSSYINDKDVKADVQSETIVKSESIQANIDPNKLVNKETNTEKNDSEPTVIVRTESVTVESPESVHYAVETLVQENKVMENVPIQANIDSKYIVHKVEEPFITDADPGELKDINLHRKSSKDLDKNESKEAIVKDTKTSKLSITKELQAPIIIPGFKPVSELLRNFESRKDFNKNVPKPEVNKVEYISNIHKEQTTKKVIVQTDNITKENKVDNEISHSKFNNNEVFNSIDEYKSLDEVFLKENDNVFIKQQEDNIKRTKSLAELNIEDAVKGKVNNILTRMTSVNRTEGDRKEVINKKEMPRKRSVSEKIALFEGKLTTSHSEMLAPLRIYNPKTTSGIPKTEHIETTTTIPKKEHTETTKDIPKTIHLRTTMGIPKKEHIETTTVTSKTEHIDTTKGISKKEYTLTTMGISTIKDLESTIDSSKIENKEVTTGISKIEYFESTTDNIETTEIPTTEYVETSTDIFENHSTELKSEVTKESNKDDEEIKKSIEDLKNVKSKYEVITDVPRLPISNGVDMPVLAIGTALLDPRIVYYVVTAAIDLGYQAIDAAYIYGNEKEVGEAIKAKIDDGTVKRDELFIMNKLWSTYHRTELVEVACMASLEAMGLEYFDLYMIHNPMSFKEGGDSIPKIAKVIQYSEHDYLDAWYGMETLVTKGLARTIGVSNFNSAQIQRIMDKGKIKPVVNQVECHPYLSQEKLDLFCSERNVTLNCYGVLGSKGTPTIFTSGQAPVIDDALVIVMASGLGVTPAQLLISYQIECGRSVVVKASSAAHLASNLAAAKLNLTMGQIDALNMLNKNKRTFTFKGMGDTHKNYPFNALF